MVTIEKKDQNIKKSPYIISNTPAGSGQSTYSDKNVLKYNELVNKK